MNYHSLQYTRQIRRKAFHTNSSHTVQATNVTTENNEVKCQNRGEILAYIHKRRLDIFYSDCMFINNTT